MLLTWKFHDASRPHPSADPTSHPSSCSWVWVCCQGQHTVGSEHNLGVSLFISLAGQGDTLSVDCGIICETLGTQHTLNMSLLSFDSIQSLLQETSFLQGPCVDRSLLQIPPIITLCIIHILYISHFRITWLGYKLSEGQTTSQYLFVL